MSRKNTDNRDSPSYLGHYNMHRSPFTTKVEPDMYYPDPIRSQRLDILSHLTQYSNELLLLTGPEGSGKTFLLQQYMERALPTWSICRISANTSMTEQKLLKQIFRGFNIAEPSNPKALSITTLKNRLESLLVTEQTVVIVIDDAHQLSNEALSALFELSATQNSNNTSNVRVILFCNPQIKIQLASPELEQKRFVKQRKIDIPALTESETGKLIHHRTMTAGLETDSVFTKSTVSKIFKLSQGIPENICEISHQILFESTPVKRRQKSRADSNISGYQPKNLSAVIVVMSLIVGVLTLLLFEDDINALYEPAANTNLTEIVLEIPKRVRPDQTINSADPSTPRHQLTVTAEVESSETARVNTLPLKNSSRTMSNQIIASDKLHTNPNPIEKLLPSNDLSDKDPSNNQNIQQVSRKQVTITHNEDWLLQQNPNHFTLQLLAGYKSKTITNFISTHNLDGKDIAYYLSFNKGKEWHSLLFGIFPNRQSAQNAINSLPGNIKSLRPWVRRIQKIQKEINS